MYYRSWTSFPIVAAGQDATLQVRFQHAARHQWLGSELSIAVDSRIATSACLAIHWGWDKPGQTAKPSPVFTSNPMLSREHRSRSNLGNSSRALLLLPRCPAVRSTRIETPPWYPYPSSPLLLRTFCPPAAKKERQKPHGCTLTAPSSEFVGCRPPPTSDSVLSWPSGSGVDLLRCDWVAAG